MKFYLQLIVLLCSVTSVFGQVEMNLFSETDPSVKSEIDLGLIDTYSLLDLNESTWKNILESHPSSLVMAIPYNETSLQLNLEKTNLYHGDLTVRTASGASFTLSNHSRSVYYHGVFEGHPNSHFALSILNNEVIGIGSIPGIGDLNLGKTNDYYVFYAEPALDGHNDFECETRGEASRPEGGGVDSREVFDVCSGIYFEIDYDIFLAKGGVIESMDYMTALFNEIQFMYELDEMPIYISEMMVWDVESPYYLIADTGILLDLFGTTTTVWTGDLGHLVTNSAGGGLAWVDVYCHPDQALRKAVSGISLTFAAVPVYSWSVEVIAHELGHNMGSPHTHACFWNGDMTAIDGCGPEAGFPEGCDATIPPLGGTVMSYCHLIGTGINLGYGFGFQPAELMRNNMAEAPCLTGCDLTVMDAKINEGEISATCENGSIYSSLSVTNNGNEDLTSFNTEIYIDGILTDTYAWVGLIAEGTTGIVNLPVFSLPLGSYTMVVQIVEPNGYDDEEPADNNHTFTFDVTPYPIANFIPSPDQLISYDAATVMQNFTIGAATYWWDMGDGTTGITETSPEHTYPFEKGGVYEVNLIATSAHGCTDTAKAEVTVIGKNIYYIANTFTPDGDDFNDEFKPIFSAGLDIYDYHLTVFNRWGEMLFESYDVTKGWDGTYGSRPADDGVYLWMIEFGDLNSDEKHTINGHVNLLR